MIQILHSKENQHFGMHTSSSLAKKDGYVDIPSVPLIVKREQREDKKNVYLVI
jgi:hypothetical protein